MVACSLVLKIKNLSADSAYFSTQFPIGESGNGVPRVGNAVQPLFVLLKDYNSWLESAGVFWGIRRMEPMKLGKLQLDNQHP